MFVSDDHVLDLVNAIYAQSIDDYIIAEEKLYKIDLEEKERVKNEYIFKTACEFLYESNPLGYTKSFIDKIIKERRIIIHEKQKQKSERQNNNKTI